MLFQKHFRGLQTKSITKYSLTPEYVHIRNILQRVIYQYNTKHIFYILNYQTHIKSKIIFGVLASCNLG